MKGRKRREEKEEKKKARMERVSLNKLCQKKTEFVLIFSHI